LAFHIIPNTLSELASTVRAAWR